MARKVFMSVLGSTNYRDCIYSDESFTATSTNYIQVAMLEKYKSIFTPNDIAYIFVTEGVNGSYSKNWMDNGHGINEGLQTKILSMNIPFDIVPVAIKNGNTEHEIWEIFRNIFSLFQQDDELYFDITHGFRYLPMLVLVLNNYSKLLKKIEIKSITYGNYEAKNSDNIAPIVNLTSLSILQDWTFAAKMFLKSGNTDEITLLLEDNNSDSLNRFVNEINECRGINLFSGNSAKEVVSFLENVNLENPAFDPLIDKIQKKVTKFQSNDVLNGFRAVEFCIEHNLIQQGITLLQEFIVSYILIEIGVQDWVQTLNRDIVTGCLSINKFEKFEVRHRKIKEPSEINPETEIARLVFDLPYKKNLTENVFISLSQGGRNDLNHAGIRQNPKPVGHFKDRLLKYMNLTKEILNLDLQ